MCRVPKVSGRDAVKALQSHGYRLATFKGSHAKLVDGKGHEVVVPMHPVISPGSYLSMAAQAGMEKDDFTNLVLGGKDDQARVSRALSIQESYKVIQALPADSGVIVLSAETREGGD